MAPSLATSFWRWTQPEGVCSKTYAAPKLEPPVGPLAPGAPRSARSPESETAAPTSQPQPSSLAVSFVLCSHVLPTRSNTYAAPEDSPAGEASRAPTSTRVPEADTAHPK